MKSRSSFTIVQQCGPELLRVKNMSTEKSISISSIGTDSNLEMSSSSLSSGESQLSFWKKRTLMEKLLLSMILLIIVGFFVAMVILIGIYLRLEEKNSTNFDNSLFIDDNNTIPFDAIPINIIPTTTIPTITTPTNVLPIGTTHTSTIPTSTIPTDKIEQPEYCLTPECVEAAARILSSLDTSADPCHDMAAFACGRWIKRQAQTPNTRDTVMVLEKLQYSIDHQIKTLLESPPRPGDLKAFGKVRRYYASCMSEGQNQTRQASVRKVMSDLGQMIPPRQWDSPFWNLTDLLAKILQVNGAPLFDVVVQVDDNDTSNYVMSVGLPRQSGVLSTFYSNPLKGLFDYASDEDLILSPGHLSRPKRQFPVDAEIDEESLSVDMLHLLASSSDIDSSTIPDAHFLSSLRQKSIDRKTTATFRLMQDVGAFTRFTFNEYQTEEAALHQMIQSIDDLSPSHKERQLVRRGTVPLANYYTIHELQNKFGFVDWLILLRKIVKPDIQASDKVVIQYPEYLTKIQALVTRSDKRVLHNSILMLLARDSILELFAAPPRVSKWSFCLQATKGGFGEIVSGLYLNEFSKAQLDNYRVKANEMIASIKRSIAEMIQSSRWLDDASRKAALRKVKNLRSNLIAPQMFLDSTFLDSVADKVNIEGIDFVSSTLELYRQFRRQYYGAYSNPVDEMTVTWQWLAHPMKANAFYLQHFNSMVVPLALLDDPIFSLETPRYLGLGSIGSIVAHEIMHGFDKAGIVFDEDGRRKALFTPYSQELYNQNLDCLSQQFSNVFQTNYSHPNGTNVLLKVDGKLTLNENLADLGAIRAIVATQMRLEKEKGPAKNLPGLINYTHEQIMLINTAQVNCALVNPQSYSYMIEMDDHTPAPDRANGFLMNLPDFGRIFNCPVGSRLNPKKKCSIW